MALSSLCTVFSRRRPTFQKTHSDSLKPAPFARGQPAKPHGVFSDLEFSTFLEQVSSTSKFLRKVGFRAKTSQMSMWDRGPTSRPAPPGPARRSGKDVRRNFEVEGPFLEARAFAEGKPSKTHSDLLKLALLHGVSLLNRTAPDINQVFVFPGPAFQHHHLHDHHIFSTVLTRSFMSGTVVVLWTLEYLTRI